MTDIFILIESFFCDCVLSVFCLRVLQFHQTLEGLEVSFVISLRVVLRMHRPSLFLSLLGTSENAEFYVSLCVGWTLHGCRVCVFLDPYTDIVSSAKFVMIVEKDATFQRLLDDDFCAKLSPCIIITVCSPFLPLLDFLNPSHQNVVSSQTGQHYCSLYITGVFVLIRVKVCLM